jgi:predicted deacylase
MTLQLKQFTFRGLSSGPHLLITGGVHGDEFEPMAAIRQLIDLFKDRDEAVSGFRGTITLIPIVNEAAFWRGHRCAADGLDLARTCPGRAEGSITEQTAWALSAAICSADYYIDLHSGGTELSVYPLAGYCLHANPGILQVQRRMARAFNLPVVWGTDPRLNGRSLSVARDANVPAIYAEYLGSATCNSAGVAAYVQGCLNVMSELEMLLRSRPVYRVQHTVEDQSSNSGHMQVCNPSPQSGYFEPTVQLGAPIHKGELIGTVFALDGSEPSLIRSTQNGIVLVLRTFPRVLAGESVGVVLETQSF